MGDDPVTHPRVVQALRDGLDLSDSGEPIVRLGPQWCYLTIDDCPLRTTAVTHSNGELRMRLDDGRTVPLDPRQLWDEPEHGLRTSAPSQATAQPLAVRFTNRAQMDLAPFFEERADGAMVLVIGDTRHVVDNVPPTAPTN